MKTIILFALLGLTANAYAIRPEREYKFTPDKRGLSYSEYQTKTIDNYSINVWEYAVPDSVKPVRTIILVGTDAGNMGYFIWQAMAIMQKGIRVISFDYRGFGKSSDFAINVDFLFHPEFSLDLDSVIKATRDKYPNDKIGLYALSMGTHISLLAKEKIDFLISEGFYNDPKKVADRIKTNRDKIVLLPADAKAIKKVRNRIPVLIFCADNDKTTTTEDAKHFSENNNVAIVEFKGEHLGGIGVLLYDYAEKITDFLARNGL